MSSHRGPGVLQSEAILPPTQMTHQDTQKEHAQEADVATGVATDGVPALDTETTANTNQTGPS